MSTLSIIIPVYNVEKYLDICIESIRQQSFKDWEIILVDDGSKDSSPLLCDKWASTDNRIKCLHISNSGPAHARNIGLDVITGEYLMFMDSDDALIGDKTVETAIHEFDTNPDIDMVQFPLVFCDENLIPYKSGQLSFPDKIVSSKKEFFEKIALFNPKPFILPGPPTKIYRKSLFMVHRFPEDMIIGEDIYLTMELLDREINKIKVVSVGAYGYRQQEASITHQKESLKYKINLLKAYSKYGNMLKKHSNDPKRLFRLYSHLEKLCVTTAQEYGFEQIPKQYLKAAKSVLPLIGTSILTKVKWLIIHTIGIGLFIRAKRIRYQSI